VPTTTSPALQSLSSTNLDPTNRDKPKGVLDVPPPTDSAKGYYRIGIHQIILSNKQPKEQAHKADARRAAPQKTQHVSLPSRLKTKPGQTNSLGPTYAPRPKATSTSSLRPQNNMGRVGAPDPMSQAIALGQSPAGTIQAQVPSPYCSPNDRPELHSPLTTHLTTPSTSVLNLDTPWPETVRNRTNMAGNGTG
jgi:hypothetical protein